jgi:hypothetical protein
MKYHLSVSFYPLAGVWLLYFSMLLSTDDPLPLTVATDPVDDPIVCAEVCCSCRHHHNVLHVPPGEGWTANTPHSDTRLSLITTLRYSLVSHHHTQILACPGLPSVHSGTMAIGP